MGEGREANSERGEKSRGGFHGRIDLLDLAEGRGDLIAPLRGALIPLIDGHR
jgi:hypothetical protein